MEFCTITMFIYIIQFLKFVGTEEEDSVKGFEHFKLHYGRVYSNPKSEQAGFRNFVKNFAEVNRLNKEHPGTFIAYELNRYADLDPKDIEQRYGIQITPNNNMENGNEEAVQRERSHKFLEDLNLYDLNHVDDAYKAWQKKWDKPPLTDDFEKQISYYRFVKSMIETNKKNFAGGNVSLGLDADQVREPNKYFFE